MNSTISLLLTLRGGTSIFDEFAIVNLKKGECFSKNELTNSLGSHYPFSQVQHDVQRRYSKDSIRRSHTSKYYCGNLVHQLTNSFGIRQESCIAEVEFEVIDHILLG